MSLYRKNLGEWGEGVAKEFVINLGYKIESSNYRTKRGEIDLICWDCDQVVFIEIKTSKSWLIKTPQEAYSKRQRDRLRCMAESYIASNQLKNNPTGFRFDFIGIKVVKNNPKITHLKNIEINPSD